MKILFDLLPIFLFFASFKWAEGHKEQAAQWMTQYLGFAVSGGAVGVKEAPVLLATVVVIVMTLLQVVVLKVLRKPVDKMLWAGLAIVVVLGGLTLWFHDETFIKWKPTVIYWVMSVGFLTTEVILGRKMLAQMMGGEIDAPDAVWRHLGWAWVLFFAAMGLLNLWVAFNYPLDTWVTFKMWGSLGLTLVFTLAQGLYLGRHMKPIKDVKAG
ncbi:MAG: septation protein A [Aquabacterium sp.]|nr:septation protein A [Aquabacterium sp.]